MENAGIVHKFRTESIFEGFSLFFIEKHLDFLSNLEKFLTKIQKRRSVESQEYHVPIKIQQTQEEAPKETKNSLQPEDTKKINSIFMFHDEEKNLKSLGIRLLHWRFQV